MLINIRHYPDKNGHEPANEEGLTPTHRDNISDHLFSINDHICTNCLTKSIEILHLEHLLSLASPSVFARSVGLKIMGDIDHMHDLQYSYH